VVLGDGHVHAIHLTADRASLQVERELHDLCHAGRSYRMSTAQEAPADVDRPPTANVGDPTFDELTGSTR
jgi:hypothetical protein